MIEYPKLKLVRGMKALSALKKVLPAQVRVYREGTLKVIGARELVPGDVISLEEGDRISADARLISAQNLSVDVSVLSCWNSGECKRGSYCATFRKVLGHYC